MRASVAGPSYRPPVTDEERERLEAIRLVTSRNYFTYFCRWVAPRIARQAVTAAAWLTAAIAAAVLVALHFR